MGDCKNIKKKSIKKVDRFLENWRNSLANTYDEGGRIYTEAFFMGAWCAFSDREVVYLLTHLSRKEMEVIMKYPLWM